MIRIRSPCPFESVRSAMKKIVKLSRGCLSSSFLDILEDGATPLSSRTKGLLVSRSAKESEEYRFAQGPSLIRLAVVWPISNWLATPYAY